MRTIKDFLLFLLWDNFIVRFSPQHWKSKWSRRPNELELAYWKEDALRYAKNADYWREKAEKAEAENKP